MSDAMMSNYALNRQRNLYDGYGNAVVGKFFVILNLERMPSLDAKPVFWKPHGAGYTDNILLAGIYTETELAEQCISGDDPVVPIQELPGLFRCDPETLKRFIK